MCWLSSETKANNIHSSPAGVLQLNVKEVEMHMFFQKT